MNVPRHPMRHYVFIPRRLGLTMVEAVISIVIVSVMLVAALSAVGNSARARRIIEDRTLGVMLAQDLLEEICRQNYADADLGPGSFGLGSDEVGDGTRERWEDVDDYHGWNGSPPENQCGVPVEGFTGWSRSVEVQWVSSSDPESPVADEEMAKRITVLVYHLGAEVARLSAVRTAVPRLNLRPGSECED